MRHSIQNKTDTPLYTEDAELIGRAAGGDSRAFRALIDRHSERVYRLAYRVLGNVEDARDTAQEVFLKLYSSLGRIDRDRELGAWLYRITVNHAVDRFRRNQRNRTVVLDDSEARELSADTGGQPDRMAEHRELMRIIRNSAGKLSKNQQKVFILRDVEGFTTEEIAEILKCKPSTVRVHLAIARHNMKKLLGNTGVSAQSYEVKS